MDGSSAGLLAGPVGYDSIRIFDPGDPQLISIVYAIGAGSWQENLIHPSFSIRSAEVFCQLLKVETRALTLLPKCRIGVPDHDQGAPPMQIGFAPAFTRIRRLIIRRDKVGQSLARRLPRPDTYRALRTMSPYLAPQADLMLSSIARYSIWCGMISAMKQPSWLFFSQPHISASPCVLCGGP